MQKCILVILQPGKKNCNLDFNIASNGMSSSLLEFDSHASEHPEIKMLSSVNVEMIKNG